MYKKSLFPVNWSHLLSVLKAVIVSYPLCLGLTVHNALCPLYHFCFKRYDLMTILLYQLLFCTSVTWHFPFYSFISHVCVSLCVSLSLQRVYFWTLAFPPIWKLCCLVCSTHSPLLQMLLYSGSKRPSVPHFLFTLFLLIFFYVSLDRLHLCVCFSFFLKGSCV